MRQEDLESLALASIGRTELPSPGDSRKRYDVVLTEPEINAIHAAHGFVKAACAAAGFKRYWQNYGPILEGLSRRLQVFDDGDAPYREQ